MRPLSSDVAAYVLKPNPADPTHAESREWISTEHFPQKDCSAILTSTIPEDLPQDLIEHLRVGLSTNPDSVLMVVRPIES